MRRAILLLALSGSAFAFPPVPRPKTTPQEADLKAMQGVWVLETFIGNGKRTPATQEQTWTVTGDRVATTFDGMLSTKFRIELGAGKEPRPLDWLLDDERKLGRYRLRDGKLEVGLGPTRPPDLSGKGSGVGVWIWKRKAP